VRYSLRFNPNTNIFPKEVIIKMQTVEFDNLWKTRAPLTEVEGFEIIPFNEIVQVSKSILFSIVLFRYSLVIIS